MSTSTYTLYFDDSGAKCLSLEKDPEKWFGLGGFIVKNEEASRLSLVVKNFNKKWAKKLKVASIVLHGSDINRYSNGFEKLRYNDSLRLLFFEELNMLMATADIVITGALLYRPEYIPYVERLGHINSIWEYSRSTYSMLIERSLKYLDKENEHFSLSVIGEKSDKKEENVIKLVHEEIKQGIMPFTSMSSKKYAVKDIALFNNLKGLSFQTKSNELLQLADLAIYAICKASITKEMNYKPFNHLLTHNRIIDTRLQEAERDTLGIKFYLYPKSIKEALNSQIYNTKKENPKEY